MDDTFLTDFLPLILTARLTNSDNLVGCYPQSSFRYVEQQPIRRVMQERKVFRVEYTTTVTNYVELSLRLNYPLYVT